jgi:HK97 family phage major capsid protein
MDGASFEYSQEVVTTEAPVEVVEGAVKPASQYDFTDATAEAKTIAHFTKMRRQQIADLPTMETIVRDRLAYGVLRRVEDQVVAGDGAGESLRGITETSGIASVTFDAGVPLAELPLEGIVDVIVSDADPNAVVLNPTDWATMVTAKTSGSGDYYGVGPFAAQAPTLWGLPAVLSKAIAAGTALVGDFSNGATLFVREGVNVRVSDSDQDDFIRNRVTALGEGRFALAVWQPAAFALVDLAA